MTETLVNSESATAISDYCCVHHGVHEFELLPVTPDSKFSGTVLESGEEARFYLRSLLPCSVERAVAPMSLNRTTVDYRWEKELAVEASLRTDPDLVPVATRRQMLLRVLDTLEEAAVVPESSCNRLVAQTLGASAAFFGLAFTTTLVTHWTVAAYTSGVGLAACVLSPFVAKGVYAFRWKRAVLALVPEAIKPLALDSETIEAGLDRRRFPILAKRIQPSSL